jgi:hypothetical protein
MAITQLTRNIAAAVAAAAETHDDEHIDVQTAVNAAIVLAESLLGYAEDLGDGVETSWTVTHNLGTDRLCIHFWDNSTGEEVALKPVRISTNAFTVNFADPPSVAGILVVVLPVRTS